MHKGTSKAKITTDYPYSGKVSIKTEGFSSVAFRIPGWCKEFQINAPYQLEDGYAYVKNPTGEILVEFNMQPMLIRANPAVQDCGGKAALVCGPLVYCMESVDNGPCLKDILIDKTPNSRIVFDEKLNTYTILADAYKHKKMEALYVPIGDDLEKTNAKFIPYYAFANRGESEMLVWCHVKY